MRRLKRKNIKQFRQFKPQAFQASSFKTDPDFRQDDSYLKNADPDFRQDDSYGEDSRQADSSELVLNLIQE